MFPDLIRIGDFSLHTYGFFIAIGIILAFCIIKIESTRVSIDYQKISDMLFWSIWAGLIGSRIFYVFYFPDEFIKNPIEIIKIWKGGLVFHGGLLFALPIVFYYIKKYNLPFLKTLDVIALAIPLAHFFGRLGCFSAGCCYGEVCELPWAVVFKNPNSIAPINIPLHPTQLYEAFLNLILFLILFLTRFKTNREGLKTGLYFSGYGIIRFTVEFFRGDLRGFLGPFSTAQWISIAFLIFGAIFILKAYKGGKK